MNLQELQDFRLNFSGDNMLVLNLCIAFIMFSVALSIRKEHFVLLLKHPKPVITGLISQLLILPLLTFLIIRIGDLPLSLGMGMILVAVCPGGNVSNFYSLIAKGNAALSVSLTAIVTTLSIITIPLFFSMWTALAYPDMETVSLEVSPLQMMSSVFIVMGIPLLIGIFLSTRWPAVSEKIGKPARIISFLILVLFLTFAVFQNSDAFKRFADDLILLVIFHNALAFGAGYGLASLTKCAPADRKTISIETGIQNATIAFALVFTFFGGNGVMAFIAGLWGVWHLIAGASLAWIFSRKSRK